ncbi:hypothetical protein ZIOFF_054567 [Zingiber officinale]|uniref:Uncharacterized protein n=1 Tax=Zingiber officinale TaxID=94328 RepID=A0A8J5FEM7_ZINOF|nr:hypothetical protein ZIOFF_054567 [Zingiber officinale]
MPGPVPSKLPESLAAAAASGGPYSGLCCAVLTSVDRNELPDDGSGHFAETVKALEVCKIFFSHSNSNLDVFAHNIETVRYEQNEEVKEDMADLRAIDVDILILGQYLQPTLLHLTVKEYVTREKFAFWKEYRESVGFHYVASGPLVSMIVSSDAY